MLKLSTKLFLIGLALVTWTGGPSTAMANSLKSMLIDDAVFSATFRTDFAYSTTSKKNPFNQAGALYTNVERDRQAYLPPPLNPLSNNWDTPIPLFSDTVVRGDSIPELDTDINYTVLRLDGEYQVHFTDRLRLNARFRTMYTPTTVFDEFHAGDVAHLQGGFQQGTYPKSRYADNTSPNYFQAKGVEGRNLNPLELAGRDYKIDLPTLILEYRLGNHNFRLGNQQIAWGQAVFFRTLDVVNGLDYRGHFILDRAIEEFEENRVPKLALRYSGQWGRDLNIDSFVGKFQPDILPNPNTAYNVVASQFYRIDDFYHENGYNKKLDFGIRVRSDYGQWGWQAIAVSRYNPFGVIKWKKTGMGQAPHGLLGGVVGTWYNAKLPASNPVCQINYDPAVCRLHDDINEAMENIIVSSDPAGIYSAHEWFNTAGANRLNGLAALNTAIEEFPTMQDLSATQVADVDEAINLLNTFFIAAGGSLRGTIQRDYQREQVFGVGASYVTESQTPGSFWNQIILNLEVQYTPERAFTAPSLTRDYLKTDEIIVSAVAEKWWRWTSKFPAAYLVGQYMHRTESDLAGLHLSGYGGTDRQQEEIVIPKGISSANYLVFAGFQPSPNRRLIFEWAMLYDVKGGILIQPNFRYSPRGGIAIDLFYNYINADLHGTRSENLMGLLDSMEEVGVRFTYNLF